MTPTNHPDDDGEGSPGSPEGREERGNSGTETGDGGDTDDDPLLAALRAAERRQPWTVEAIRDVASDPAATKATAPACVSCDAPCRDDEVCATVVVRQAGVFDEVGRDRAFHLIESGMKRLRTRDEATIRELEDEIRPNFFVSLSTDED